MSPFFSIIVPVYNVAAYLHKCLDSVRNQSFADWEVICADDGSTDGCGAILDAYVAMDDRIKVIHQDNSGVSAARNAALNKATGDWIMMLDADDWYDDGFLSRVYKMVVGYGNVDCFVYGFECVNVDSGHPSKHSDKRYVCKKMPGDEMLGACPSGVWRFTHNCWDKIYRRSVLETYNIRFMVGMSLGEDTLFSNKFLSVCGDVVINEGENGYKYVTREGSAIKTLTAKKLSNDLLRFKDTLNWWNAYNRPGLFKTLIFLACRLPFLGKSHKCRRECIDILLQSDLFNQSVIGFLSQHGPLKARIFAKVYKCAPSRLRRKILEVL